MLNIACQKVVVALKQSKHVYSLSRDTTDYITLLCCGSATGTAIPPMIIYSTSFPGGNIINLMGQIMPCMLKVNPGG